MNRQTILFILAVIAGVIATLAGFDAIFDLEDFWGWAALTATLALASRIP